MAISVHCCDSKYVLASFDGCSMQLWSVCTDTSHIYPVTMDNGERLYCQAIATVHTQKKLCMCVRTHTHTIHTCIHTHTHTYAYTLHTLTRTHSSTHTYTHIAKHTRTHSNTHTSTQARMHSCTRTHSIQTHHQEHFSPSQYCHPTVTSMHRCVQQRSRSF